MLSVEQLSFDVILGDRNFVNWNSVASAADGDSNLFYETWSRYCKHVSLDSSTFQGESECLSAICSAACFGLVEAAARILADSMKDTALGPGIHPVKVMRRLSFWDFAKDDNLTDRLLSSVKSIRDGQGKACPGIAR